MGIPSYFSYIIKNYTNIIRKLPEIKSLNQIHHLMMDCNSIIYDAYRILETQHKINPVDKSTVESFLIKQVLDKIHGYIQFIEPTNSVFITFDGVAPFAKMSQQKTRRYKSEFSKITDQQTSGLCNCGNIKGASKSYLQGKERSCGQGVCICLKLVSSIKE